MCYYANQPHNTIYTTKNHPYKNEIQPIMSLKSPTKTLIHLKTKTKEVQTAQINSENK